MTLMHDVRAALRGFRRTPAFTVTAALTLGIGIGMSAAMYAVYDTVLRRDLPVRDGDRLVVLWTHRGDPAQEVSGSFKLLEGQVRSASHTLSDVAGVAHWGATPAPFLSGDEAVVLNRTLVSANFFEVLGSTPALGRLLRRDDSGTDAVRALVLSYGAWQRRFGGDSSVVGRRLRDAYGPTNYTIVGVAPAGLDYPTAVEAWTPPWSADLSAFAVGRLAPNVSSAAARDEYRSIVGRLLPDWHLAGATVTDFSDIVRGKVRPVVGVLAGAVGVLLLITCVNVGNLLLLRAGSREREIAIRRALGASYADVARQLGVESALLGVAGGALGLMCAQVLLALLVATAPANLPRLDALRLETVPLGACIALTLIAVGIFGVLPTLAGAGSTLTSALRSDGRSGTGTRVRRRLRQALVASQVALALVLLAGAGLLARSLDRLTHLDLGYTSGHLAIVQVSWQSPEPARTIPTGDALLQRYRGIPGVTAVTPVLIPPFLGRNVFHGQVITEGQSQTEQDNAPSVPLELGDQDYFRTFGTPIVRGRGFLESDREGAPKVAVLSESIARRLWPDANPIGKRIRYMGPDSVTWRTVVGVARDTRFRSLRDPSPTIYLPWRQTDSWQLAFAVRTSGTLASVANALQRETRRVDAGLTVWESQSMDDFLSGPLAQPRLSAFLLSGFGFVALLLAALGLYGVMASAVRDQTRELGVRMALGATPGRVRRDVLGRAIAVTSVGAAAGLVGVLVGSRFLAALLFEVSPMDPIALLGASAVLLAVGILAAYVPARRATRIAPMEALRAE